MVDSLQFIEATQRKKKWGHALAQLVEALGYKPEGHGFDSRWCQIFFVDIIPGVDSASNRNEYQECFLGVKATGAVYCEKHIYGSTLCWQNSEFLNVEQGGPHSQHSALSCSKRRTEA
jgi:hypothetical protein